MNKNVQYYMPATTIIKTKILNNKVQFKKIINKIYQEFHQNPEIFYNLCHQELLQIGTPLGLM